MARHPDPIVDRTALSASTIDVAARIGWLLRSWRTRRGVNLAAMAERLTDLGLPTSAPTLSALEKDGIRDGHVIEAYESLLDLTGGSLLSSVAVLCRTFPHAPADRAPAVPRLNGLADFDAVVEPALDGTASGGDWYALARILTSSDRWALPSRVLAPVAGDLVRELVRSVGPAYLTRYEAIAVLRDGVYADLVEDAVRVMVDEPGAEPCVLNAMVAIAEQPTERLLDWYGEQLRSGSAWRVSGAAYSLQVMRTIGGLPPRAWARLTEPFVEAVADAAVGSANSRQLTRLWKALPPGPRADIEQRLPRSLDAVPGPASWRPREDNPDAALCHRIAQEIVGDAVHDAPMLGRLLFEVIHDFRSPLVAASAHLLSVSPHIEAVQSALLRLAVEGGNESTRTGAVRALHFSQAAVGEAEIAAWFAGVDPRDNPATLLVAANAGLDIGDRFRHLLCEDVDLGLRVVECLGMAASPTLASVVDDPAGLEPVRDSAAWWLRNGGRVTV